MHNIFIKHYGIFLAYLFAYIILPALTALWIMLRVDGYINLHSILRSAAAGFIFGAFLWRVTFYRIFLEIPANTVVSLQNTLFPKNVVDKTGKQDEKLGVDLEERWHGIFLIPPWWGVYTIIDTGQLIDGVAKNKDSSPISFRTSDGAEIVSNGEIVFSIKPDPKFIDNYSNISKDTDKRDQEILNKVSGLVVGATSTVGKDRTKEQVVSETIQFSRDVLEYMEKSCIEELNKIGVSMWSIVHGDLNERQEVIQAEQGKIILQKQIQTAKDELSAIGIKNPTHQQIMDFVDAQQINAGTRKALNIKGLEGQDSSAAAALLAANALNATGSTTPSKGKGGKP